MAKRKFVDLHGSGCLRRPVAHGDGERARRRGRALCAQLAVESLSRAIGAGTARGGNAEFVLQLAEITATSFDFARDVAVGDSVADADDHGRVGGWVNEA